MQRAVEWYHQRLLDDPAARPARDYLRQRGLAGDVARQFKIGWAPDDWDALSRDLARAAGGAAGHRARLPEQAQQDAGLVPGAGDVPDLLRGGRGARLRWPDPAGIRRPGEVQELGGDGDLQQVEDALRAELGEGRHRQGRPGGGVRGLHRRDRVPSGGCATGGRDVWHRVDRGTRTPAEAVCEQGRAGVRRRRRGTGSRGAVLRVGAEARRRGLGGRACRRGRIRGNSPSPIPTSLGASVASSVPFLGFRLQRTLHARAAETPEQRARLAEEAMAVVNEHPNANVRKLYAGEVAARVGLPVADLVRLAERGMKHPSIQVSRAGARHPMENAEFAALVLLVQDWNSIAPWLVEAAVRRRRQPDGVPRARRVGRRLSRRVGPRRARCP